MKTITMRAMMAAGMGLIPYTPALAETTGVPILEEVIVTAQKRAQNIMEVPTSLQTFQGEELESAGHSELALFLREVPSATMANNSGGGAFNVVHMRGSGGLGQTGDGAVAYYLDEVPFVVPNNQFSPISNMFDLQRVEVLRGPQGTIWGQGSMAGTVRYLLNNPDLENFGGRVQTSWADVKDGDNSYKLNAVVNIPVVENVFGLRIAGGHETRGGYAEAPDVNREDINKEELENWRVKALWQASDSLSVNALYWHMEIEMDYSNTLQILDPPTMSATGGIEGLLGGESDVYSLTLNWSLNNFDLVATTSSLDHVVPLLIPFSSPATGNIIATQHYESETFAQEIRLVSNGDGPLSWIAGGYYSDTNHEQRQDQFFANSLFQSIVGIDSTQKIESETFALFGEISYELMGGKLIPLFGLRYFKDDRGMVDNSIQARGIDESGFGTCDPNFLPAPLKCETVVPTFRTSDTFESFNPRINLSWFPGEAGMLYLNIAKGFRSGYLQTLAAVNVGAFEGVTTTQSLDDDAVWSYELGGKWNLLDNRLALEFAVYRAEYKDAQVLYNTQVNIPVGVQGGDYRADGVELTFDYSPVDGLNFAGVFSALNSEWTDPNPEIEAAVVGRRAGRQCTVHPENRLEPVGYLHWRAG